jgi:hypothetical protein
MARRKKAGEKPGDWLFPNLTTTDDVDDQSSLLDVVDNVLNRGAVLTGDLVLGVANVDLIYVKLSVLLAALDKVMKNDPAFKPVAAGPNRKGAKHRKPRRQKT